MCLCQRLISNQADGVLPEAPQWHIVDGFAGKLVPFRKGTDIVV